MNGYIRKEIVQARIEKLLLVLKQTDKNYDTILIVDKVNQYYFTGSMQDAVLVIRADGSYGYFVRKSYERATKETGLSNVYQMRSYRDMLEFLPTDLGKVLLEASIMPLLMLQRLKKVFHFSDIGSIEPYIMQLRMLKSQDELELIRKAGSAQNKILTQIVPELLREGMSEAELMAELYAAMIKAGHHGVSRFSMFQLDMVAGQLGFGENSLYPTCFDGPGGMMGMSPAVPAVGSRERLLRKGDLVFVDIGFGIDGYHSDKTQVYSFGSAPDSSVLTVHRSCLDVLNDVSARLNPGAIPEIIYQETMNNLSPLLAENFMGMGAERVQFLGHGVGLQVDEPPVIAKGFSQPLADGMVLAIEPKRGISGVGMVGAEETFIVREDGAECVTGGARDMIVV